MPILPILSAYLLFRLFRKRRPRGEAALQAAAIWGVLLLCMTEVLSAFHALDVVGIAGGWVLMIALLAAMLRRPARPTAPVLEPEAVPRWVSIPVAVTLAATLVIALVAPPNSTDSMTYHLARVAQWIQRASVEPYATSIVRQIFMPPWADYAILHFQVLAGGSDRLAPLVQWLAFAGCMVLAADIARQLGGSGGERGLAVVLTATLPMAVVQASSTQADLVTAFWCGVFAWTVLAAEPRAEPGHALLPASALGLAMATKGTAYVVCAPFALWWLISRGRAIGWRRGAVQAAAFGVVVVLLNAPMFARNVGLFDHPLGPTEQRTALANTSYGLGPLTSNLVRNATLHLATPNETWNAALADGVERLHRLVGLDPSDPRTTWHENEFGVRILRTKESRTGNPFHFMLLGVALLVLCLRPSPAVHRRYALAVLLGGVLFCWVFRWQQWHSRLHTPLFLLAGPLVAVALGPMLTGNRKAFLGLALWVAALPWLVANESRPLLRIRALTQTPSILATPRAHQYFVEDAGIEAPYRRVVADLVRTGCDTLGVAGGEKTGVYPLVPLARAHGLRLKLIYVNVDNETRILEEHPRICALLVEEHGADWRPEPPYDALKLAWRDERVAFWVDGAYSTVSGTGAGQQPRPRRSGA
ncbi:MAG: ArnT family glycosyltransferase [Gemmatimonadales bacterium]